MQITKIITVTLNPSLDRTVFTHHLALGYQNHTSEPTRLDPAGRGMNISRALHRLNCPTHGILLLGDDATGRAYRALIAEEGFPIAVAQRQGRTRSNIIIVDTGTGAETHLIEESAGVPQEGFEFVVDTLQHIIAPGDVVVYAGGLPAEAYPTTYEWLTGIAHEAGAQVALVTSGEPLSQALGANPDLIMLRQIELEAFFNHPVRVYKDVIGASDKLRELGANRVLTITSEVGGAVLVSNEGSWLSEMPVFKVGEAGTSSGVADALLSGFMAGRFQNRSLDGALALGVASAAFTASQPGNEFGSMEQAEELIESGKVHVVETHKSGKID